MKLQAASFPMLPSPSRFDFFTLCICRLPDVHTRVLIPCFELLLLRRIQLRFLKERKKSKGRQRDKEELGKKERRGNEAVEDKISAGGDSLSIRQKGASPAVKGTDWSSQISWMPSCSHANRKLRTCLDSLQRNVPPCINHSFNVLVL